MTSYLCKLLCTLCTTNIFWTELKIPCAHSQRVIFCRDWENNTTKNNKVELFVRENPTKSCNIILFHHDGGLKLKGNEIHSIVPLALVNITERERQCVIPPTSISPKPILDERKWSHRFLQYLAHNF